MNEKHLIEALSNLVQLDIDAVHAYDQTLRKIDDPIIKDRLLKFQDDHRNHANGLSKEIENLGGNPPEQSKDFKTKPKLSRVVSYLTGRLPTCPDPC